MSSKRGKTLTKQKTVKLPERAFAMPGKAWQAGLACVMIAVMAVVAYNNSFSGELVFDNYKVIKDNPLLKEEGNTLKIFESNYWAPGPSDLYRPLTIYTYYLNYKILGWGDKPRGYHVWNLVLHILNGCLIFFLVSRISGRSLVGAFSAVLFVVHPVATEAVTNIVGRADLMAMFFVLAAFLLHIYGSMAEGGRRFIYYVLGAFCIFLGLLSKENAIAAIAVFAAFDLVLLWPAMRAKAGGRGIWRWLLARLPSCYGFYAVAIAAWFAIRYFVLNSDEFVGSYIASFIANPLDYAPFLWREATAIVMLGLYLVRLVWPVVLSADYSYNQVPVVTSALNPAFLVSLVALALIILAGVLLWRRSPIASFFIWFFFICIAPVSNIFITIGTIGAERLLYMPSLAWSAVVALGLIWLCGRLKAGQVTAAVVVLACIAGLYTYRTIVRNEDWRTEKAFWLATYHTSPNSVAAIGGYAGTLVHDDPGRALELLKTAFQIEDRDLTNAVYYCDAAIGVGDETGKIDSEKARAIYMEAYKRMERLIDEETPITLEVKRRLLAQGKRPSDLVRGGEFETRVKLIKLAERIADTYKDGEMYRKYYVLALENARRAVLLKTDNPVPDMSIANALQKLAAPLLDGDPERQLFLEEAVISSMRAYFVNQSAWYALTMLRDSYSARIAMDDLKDKGLDPDDLVAGFKTGNYKSQQDREYGEKFRRRAARSQVMIELALGHRNGIDTLIKRAIGFGVARADLEPLLSETFSPDDERIWTGE
jgi:hypothetical protein